MVGAHSGWEEPLSLQQSAKTTAEQLPADRRQVNERKMGLEFMIDILLEGFNCARACMHSVLPINLQVTRDDRVNNCML